MEDREARNPQRAMGVGAQMIDTEIIVEDSHFEYLALQKGRLDAAKKQRGTWHALYQRDLRSTYDEIKPFLPAQCWGLLDIGSGLGGIDVLLYRHYRHLGYMKSLVSGSGSLNGPYINLLDGENDPAVMKLHRQTFNSMRVAKDFQVKNGVPAERFFYYTPDSQDFVKPFDLVVSFGSWGFHYEPDVYLPRLFAGGGLTRGSRIIMDVRRDKQEWKEQLRKRLHCIGVIREARKFTRLAYVVE